MIKKLTVFFLSFLTAFKVLADDVVKTEDVAMADKLRADGKIYVVVLVLLIVFIGIAIYLFMMDRKVSRLENELKNK